MRRIKLIVWLLAAALMLSACGGGGGGGSGVGASVDAATAFTTAVAAIAATPLDTVEADPAVVDSATAATSDSAEPIPI